MAPYSCLPAGFKWERPISRARGGSQSPGRVWISTPEDLFRGPGVEIRPWAGIGARRAGCDRFVGGFCLGSAWVSLVWGENWQKKGVFGGTMPWFGHFGGPGGVWEGGSWGGPRGGPRGGPGRGAIFGGLGGKNLYRRENACKNGPFSCFCVPGTGKTTFLAILDPFLGLGPLRDSSGSIGLAILDPWKVHFGANLMGFRDPGPLRGR